MLRPMPRRLLPLFAIPVLLAACAREAPDQRSPFAAPANGESRDREQNARAAAEAFDRELAAINALPMAQALERQGTLAPRLGELAAACAGTAYENRAVYLQAQWCFQFRADGAGVDQALDRLDGLEKPILKQSGRALRVQHLLRQERLGLARSRAEQLINEVPEFAFLETMVRWHERAGGTVDDTGGIGLDGAPFDPARSPERWVLYLHLAGWDERAALLVRRYADAIGGRDVRLVPVIRDGGARRIGDDLAAIPGTVRITPLWARGPEEAKRLLTVWTPPLDGWTVLLDGDRRIARVEVRPGDLAGLTEAPAAR